MKTQQCCVLTSAIGTILIGIAMVLVSRFLLDADVVIRHLEPTFIDAILILGVSAFLVGILGACGACFSSPLALGVYGFADLFIALAGLIIGFVLLFTSNMHSIDIKQACELVRQAGSSSSALAKQYQMSYDSMKEALMNCRQNGRPDALGLQDCGQLGRDSSGRWFHEDPQRELFGWAERLSGCGGFCTGDLPLFGLPASPNGKVDQSTKTNQRSPCYRWIANELQVRGSTKSVLIILLASPLLVAVCGALWIICHPPPRARKDVTYPEAADEPESHRLLPGNLWAYASEESGSEEELD
jgi:hypothetical protein